MADTLTITIIGTPAIIVRHPHAFLVLCACWCFIVGFWSALLITRGGRNG